MSAAESPGPLSPAIKEVVVPESVEVESQGFTDLRLVEKSVKIPKKSNVAELRQKFSEGPSAGPFGKVSGKPRKDDLKEFQVSSFYFYVLRLIYLIERFHLVKFQDPVMTS